MSDPKIIKNGRMDIYPNTRPKPPSVDSHISPEVREALSKQIPEIRRGVLDVAGRK
jgi:hypothetical protein